MEISGSTDGMHVAQQKFDRSSQEIVEKSISSKPDDITKGIVNQKEAEVAFSANARVAKVQDNMLGEVIDLLA